MLGRRKIAEIVARARNGMPLRSGGRLSGFGIGAGEAQSAIGAAPCRLEQIFLETTTPSVTKWLHYLPLYEKYFERFRGTAFRMLEIGVLDGGSIAMWREFFGPQATIWGIEINPECAARVYEPNVARIGSQADPEFLRRTIAEMGGVDLVLDDGSHVACHQRASFETLFPLLADDGLYVIEDLHTAYWPDIFQGGFRRPGTAVEAGKRLVDDLHHRYHPHGFATVARDRVTGVHFHDSNLFIDKGRQIKPGLARMGMDEAPVQIWLDDGSVTDMSPETFAAIGNPT